MEAKAVVKKLKHTKVEAAQAHAEVAAAQVKKGVGLATMATMISLQIIEVEVATTTQDWL